MAISSEEARRRAHVQKMRDEHARSSEARRMHKQQSVHRIKEKTLQDNIKDSIHNANRFNHGHAHAGPAQLPFTATGLLEFAEGWCVGSVIHNVNHVGPPALQATYVLTAGHCCWDQDLESMVPNPRPHTNFRFSWVANSRMPERNIVWNLGLEAAPHMVTGHNHGVADCDDWCVIAFTAGPNVGAAPAVLHIKYDDAHPKPPGDALLWSTYWTAHQGPPNPQEDDYLKKYAQANVREHSPGVWKLIKEYTAEGMSGSPFVETGHRDLIRGTLASGAHTDKICKIDRQEFIDIRTAVNNHVQHAPHPAAVPIMGENIVGRSGTSAAHHFSGDILSAYSGDKELEENSNGYGLDYEHHNGHHVSGNNEHGEMELVTNKYYNQYGEHDHDHPDNVYLFAMGVIMTIGICCFVMIISIMINFCACVASKYYKIRDYRQSKHGGDRYNIIEHDVDGDQV